jgi:Probable transposase
MVSDAISFLNTVNPLDFLGRTSRQFYVLGASAWLRRCKSPCIGAVRSHLPGGARLRAYARTFIDTPFWKPLTFKQGRKERARTCSALDFFVHLCYTSLMNETLIRTISIKLDIDGHEAVLQETQKHFNDAASWIASICWNEHITNTNTAHHRVYGETRTRFGLGAQLAICARAKAVEAIKATKTKKGETCPQFGPRGSIRYDARTYRLMSLDRVSLNTLQRRVTCKMILGKRQRDMLVDQTWKIGGADLVWRRGTYYLNVTQSKEAPLIVETTDTLGVDLGIVNLATDSTGEAFSGAQIKVARERYHKRRQILQKIGTRSAKRRLKKMSGREKRFQKDTNHRISKALIKKAVHTRKAIALEDLTGIRERISGIFSPLSLHTA